MTSGVALVIAGGVTALCLDDIRLHRLLGCLAFLSARRRSRRHTITPLADAVSRRTQRASLGFSVHSAALHFLHHPFSRFHDVRRLFRDRRRHRSSRDTIARARTIRASPRRARDCIYRFTRALAASRDLDEALPKVFALIKEAFKQMPRFGCVTRAVCRATGRARSRRRAKMKASRSGRFKKNKRRKIDRHVAGCGRVARAACHRRSRRRCADCASGHPPTLEQRELLDAFAAQLALFVNKERRSGRKPRRTNFPAISEVAESAFRFRLTRIEDTARRDVGCIAIRKTFGRTQPRGVAAGRAASDANGGSFARRDPFGIGAACNRCVNGAIRPSWCAKPSLHRD